MVVVCEWGGGGWRKREARQAMDSIVNAKQAAQGHCRWPCQGGALHTHLLRGCPRLLKQGAPPPGLSCRLLCLFRGLLRLFQLGGQAVHLTRQLILLMLHRRAHRRQLQRQEEGARGTGELESCIC